ncbi:MAG: ABC transporter ATP-binding protein [Fibrobacterota bacterium]|nr:ABC transporter ATP-binding protein [Chitinispirillaceae bacterium]
MKFELSGLTYTYKKTDAHALVNIDLQLDTSTITGLVGANGSGKSTLIKILLRQIVNYTGSYTIDTTIINDYTGSIPGNYKIGYAPEEVILDDALSGYEMLHIIKEVRSIPDQEFIDELEQLCDELRVDDWLKTRTCGEYSQGMRRKTAILCAMIGPLKYIILDEPNNGLDPLSIYGLKQAILRRKQNGTGVLVSTHILDIIDKISENVVMMRKGHIIYDGTVEKLKSTWSDKATLEEIYFEMYSQADRNDLK